VLIALVLESMIGILVHLPARLLHPKLGGLEKLSSGINIFHVISMDVDFLA
jgi:hypothetical protein